MGLGQNGVVLSFFLSQNDVVLTLQFFLKNFAYTKTTSFWTKLLQNGIVLEQLSHNQNDVVRFGYVKAAPKRRRFVIYLKKKQKTKRRRFINFKDKTTSFCFCLLPKKAAASLFIISFCSSLGEGGEEGSGGTANCDGKRRRRRQIWTDKGAGERRRRRRRCNGDAATATKWVGFPPDFFPSLNCLFRFPSYLEVVSVFLLFIEIFVSVIWNIKNGSRVVVFCQWNLCIFHASLIFWFSISHFHGFVFFCFQRL